MSEDMFKNTRRLLEDNGYDIDNENMSDSFILPDDFVDGIVGVTTDYQVVYDFNLMIQSLMNHNGWTEQEALDWVDFNTMNALPNFDADKRPIIINSIYRYVEGEVGNMKNVIAKFEKVSYEQFSKDMKNCFEDISDEDIHSVYCDIQIPKRATDGSAGYDFIAPFGINIPKGEAIVIPTGIRCKIEEGWFLDLRPRSGQGFKAGIHLANTTGVIDSDYYNAKNEGHIMVKLVNDSALAPNEFKVDEGNGFCQGIFLIHGYAEDDTTDAVREGGFGSTDNK